METSIPSKSLFKQDEVCHLTGVKPYVLRFWESEFDEISPIQNSSGKKLYEQSDIKAIQVIKYLLFEDKLTVEKAKYELTKIDVERFRIPGCENVQDDNFLDDNASDEGSFKQEISSLQGDDKTFDCLSSESDSQESDSQLSSEDLVSHEKDFLDRDEELSSMSPEIKESWLIAKAKLSKMLEITESIQKGHNWH